MSYPRATGIALMATLLLAVSAPAAEAKNCSRVSPAKIIVELDEGKIEVGREYSHAKLAGSKGAIPGRTTATSSAKYDISHRYERMGNGEYCGSASKIKVTIGYKEIAVDIAKEYKKKSCEYKAVYAHEKKNVSALRKVLKKYRKRLESRLNGKAKNMGVFTGGSAKAISKKIRKKTAKFVNPVLDKMEAAAGKAMAKVNTTKAYKKVYAKCKKWKS